jgi:hypothetical protein
MIAYSHHLNPNIALRNFAESRPQELFLPEQGGMVLTPYSSSEGCPLN